MLASMSYLPNINNSDIEGLNYMLCSVLYMKKKGVQCWVCMTNQHWHHESSILTSESFQCSTKTSQHWHFKSSLLGSMLHHVLYMLQSRERVPTLERVLTAYFWPNFQYRVRAYSNEYSPWSEFCATMECTCGVWEPQLYKEKDQCWVCMTNQHWH